MKASASPTVTGISTSTVILGLLAALLVFTVLTGRRVPLVSNERTALVVLLVIGMAMCMPGIGRVAASGQWAHPLSILGYLFGALILVIGVVAALGRPLPFIPDARNAMIAVSALTVVKLVISIVHRVLWL